MVFNATFNNISVIYRGGHTDKAKDRVTRTPLRPGVNSCAPEG